MFFVLKDNVYAQIERMQQLNDAIAICHCMTHKFQNSFSNLPHVLVGEASQKIENETCIDIQQPCMPFHHTLTPKTISYNRQHTTYKQEHLHSKHKSESNIQFTPHLSLHKTLSSIFEHVVVFGPNEIEKQKQKQRMGAMLLVEDTTTQFSVMG